MHGRVLYVDGNDVWGASGCAIVHSGDGGETWRRRARLRTSLADGIKMRSRLGRRLFRYGFHHFVRTDEDAALLIGNRGIFRMDSGCDDLIAVAELRGSRPLTVCMQGGRIYYGEYRGNPERSPVHVWAGDRDGTHWRPVWRFERVRHVHGVFCDPFTQSLWVTTGDDDEEAAIWVTNDGFRTLDQVIGGSQQHRVVQLLFTEDHVYFGSDTPHQTNFIYRMDRAGRAPQRMQQVGGSVFFGCTLGRKLYFSTAVEPSEVNRSRIAEIWECADGENWRQVVGFCKDRWPGKLFQYGQVFFPAGEGNGKTLWYTPFATAFDQVSLQLQR